MFVCDGTLRQVHHVYQVGASVDGVCRGGDTFIIYLEFTGCMTRKEALSDLDLDLDLIC